ncbi:hypothetical protein EJB05_26450 [Eragrostis curvula]|uniref:Uncharacterized protein n=1 Tax=Eragrostis curvula TaxID=38414 RepID=A0A5J9UKI7_9POAL|nr:hypothetical protein EJB05_26450 [Eragrostis curvula]
MGPETQGSGGSSGPAPWRHLRHRACHRASGCDNSGDSGRRSSGLRLDRTRDAREWRQQLPAQVDLLINRNVPVLWCRIYSEGQWFLFRFLRPGIWIWGRVSACSRKGVEPAAASAVTGPDTLPMP